MPVFLSRDLCAKRLETAWNKGCSDSNVAENFLNDSTNKDAMQAAVSREKRKEYPNQMPFPEVADSGSFFAFYFAARLL